MSHYTYTGLHTGILHYYTEGSGFGMSCADRVSFFAVALSYLLYIYIHV